jgi:hypothetical protein
MIPDSAVGESAPCPFSATSRPTLAACVRAGTPLELEDTKLSRVAAK